MSVPYVVLTHSRIPRLLRHDAVTLWPFIWYRHAEIPRGTLVHELTHAYQQLLTAVAWLLGVGLVAGWSWWLLLAHPLPFLVLYGLSCVRGYSRSPFERHAEWCRARWLERHR